MYDPDVSDMSEEQKAANAALVEKAHRAGDKYSWVEGILLRGKRVRYYYDTCAVGSLKPKVCLYYDLLHSALRVFLQGYNTLYAKFSKADFTGLASCKEALAERSSEDVSQAEKVSKEVKALLTKKEEVKVLPYNSGPIYRSNGFPIYRLTSPFVLNATD